MSSYVRGDGVWVYYSSMGVSLVCIISLACCTDVRRKFPLNFIFLGIFTLCEGLMLGTISSFYDVGELSEIRFYLILTPGAV